MPGKSAMDQNDACQNEPPSCLSTQIFYIGKNRRGHWVVRDQNHTCGGLFVDRAEAVRFAMFENGRKRQAVVMVPEPLELDLNASAENGAAPRLKKVVNG